MSHLNRRKLSFYCSVSMEVSQVRFVNISSLLIVELKSYCTSSENTNEIGWNSGLTDFRNIAVIKVQNNHHLEKKKKNKSQGMYLKFAFRNQFYDSKHCEFRIFPSYQVRQG